MTILYQSLSIPLQSDIGLNTTPNVVLISMRYSNHSSVYTSVCVMVAGKCHSRVEVKKTREKWCR